MSRGGRQCRLLVLLDISKAWCDLIRARYDTVSFHNTIFHRCCLSSNFVKQGFTYSSSLARLSAAFGRVSHQRLARKVNSFHHFTQNP